MDVNEIEARIKAGQVVSDAERAFLIRYNPHAWAAFMIDNNPGGLNYILRNQLGYDYLKYDPDKNALLRTMEVILNRKNASEIQYILNNFVVMDKGFTPQFINSLQNLFKK